MPTYVDSVPRVLTEKLGEFPSLLDFGVTGKGPSIDDTANIQKAVDSVGALGGGYLYAPRPEVSYSATDEIVIPSGVIIRGDGAASLFQKTGSIAAGKGLFRLAGDGCGLQGIQIDGGVTTSVGVDVATISDPAANALSQDSSIWIPSGSANILIEGVTITHTGGYAIFVDARTGNIYNLRVLDSIFVNNRPHKFGPSGNEIYGSWTGGILLKNDGTSYGVKGVTVSRCRWSRVTGNCLWGHGNGFGAFHENITFTDNAFEDFGLDGIEVGNMVGGVVSGNKFRRGGFLHSTDGDAPAPLTNPTTYSVAIDSTGYVQGVSIDGNTVTNQNGGAIDLDGFFDGSVTNNTLTNAFPTDPTYVADQVGSFGPTKGIQTGNSFYRYAGRNITIDNNTIINFNTNALSLKNAKYCKVTNNKIFHPSAATSIPILIFNVRGANQTYAAWALDSTDYRSYGNTVSYNKISYSGANYAIAEIEYNDGTNTYPFQAGDVNEVFNNPNPVPNVYGEWLKAVSSGSAAMFSLPTNDTSAAGLSSAIFQREGIGVTAATKIYKNIGGTTTQILQISDDALVNASVGGAALTGAFTTGNRSSLAWPDAIATGKIVGDSIIAMGAGTFADADADLLDDNWGLQRWNNTLKIWEQSTSTVVVGAGPATARVWTPLGGGLTPPVLIGDPPVNATGLLTVHRLTGNVNEVMADFVLNEYQSSSDSGALRAVAAVHSGTASHTRAGEFHAIRALAIGQVLPIAGTGVTWGLEVGVHSDVAPTANSTENCGVTVMSSHVGWTLGSGARNNIGVYVAGADGWEFGFRYDDVGGSNLFRVDQYGRMWSKEAVINGIGQATTAFDPVASFGGSLYLQDLGGAANNGGALMLGDGHGPFAVVKGLLTSGTGPLGAVSIQTRLLGTDTTFTEVARFQSGSGLTLFGTSGLLINANSAFQVDYAGAVSTSGVITSSAGVNVTTVTAANAIQASVGGVTAKYLVTTESIFGIAVAAPSVSAAAQGKIHFNSTSNKWEYSENGSSWANCFGGSGGVAGANRQVQFNNSGAFGASTGLTWNDTSKQLAVTGITATAGLTVLTSYINSAEGFLTASTATDAIQAIGGGVTALYLIATESIFGIAVATPAVSAAGQGKLHFNTTANKWQFSENGSSWANCFGAGSTIAGANTEVQYNNSGSSGASPNFTWTNGSKLLTVTGATGTAGIAAVTCYIQSAEGFLTTSSASTAVNASAGGVTALSLISIRNDGVAGLTLQRTSATPRQYGLGIDSAGTLFLNDATAGANRLTVAGGGDVSLLGPAGGAQIVYVTAAASQASFIEFGPSTLWVEFQGSTIGDWLVGHYGVAAGVFKSVRSGALANTLVLNSGRATVLGVAANAGITLTNGYMSSSEGYFTGSANTDAVKVLNGGVTAKYHIATESLFGLAVATPAVSAAGQGKLHFNSTANRWQYSENGGAWTTCFVGGGTPSGSNTQIQYNNSGAFGASANFTYAPTTGVFTITGPALAGPTAAGVLTYSSATGALSISGPANTNILSSVTASGTGSAFWLLGTAGGTAEFQVNTTGDFWMGMTGIVAGVVRMVRAGSVGATMILNAGNVTLAKQLVVGGIASGQGILLSAGYMQSAEGFLTASTATNAIQAPAGGMTAASFDGIASGFNAEFRLTSYGAVPAFIGRAAGGSSGAPTQVLNGATLMTIGGRGFHSSGAFTTSASAAILFAASENWTSIAQGSNAQFSTTPVGSTTRVTRLTIADSGLITTANQLIVGGAASGAGLTITDGYVTAVDGYIATGAGFNIIQATSGGVFGATGLTTDQGVYLKTLGTGTTPSTPGGGYGCIGHRSGTTYWYWNGSSYASVDFSSSGGGVTSVSGGTGVSVSPSTGSVVVSIGQAVGTGNSVSFANVTSSGVVQAGATGTSITFQNTNSNFSVNGNGVVSCVGPINCTGGATFGSTINATGVIVGTGTSGGISARAFNPRNSVGSQLFGADFTFPDNFGVTHTVVGGVLVS